MIVGLSSADGITGASTSEPRIGRLSAPDLPAKPTGLTIAQIRDRVDSLATSGQLTTTQQIALISAGFQDLDARNPGYQPINQEGYSRSSTQAINFTQVLGGIAAFHASRGDVEGSKVYSSLVTLFSEKGTPSNLNIKA